ncbi:MAG: cytochrome P450 [Thermoleophilia bacterium]|nr:cytochrome P450 [Thermoleophilia bacterium]
MASTDRKYDLYGPEFRADPHATFARMREHDPVFCQPGIDGETMIWFVTRHEDAAAMLLDDERFVRDPRLALTEEELAGRPVPPALELIDNHMLNRDGEDHRRLRRLVTKAFTPRMVEQLRPRIQAIADELLDAVEARGSMDLSAEYAFPLPITVIAEMLGVPSADHARFKEWSDAIVTPAVADEDMERFFALMGDFVAYLTDFFAARRADPRDDLVSALLAARDDDDALTEEELFGTVVLLIVAGHETTVGLIGNAVVSLLACPEQLDLLRADPSLLPGAIEEVLRFEGPVERALNRWATTDVELGGQTIRRGELVIAILGSADRDPERFPGPDRLDVSRADTRHLAFGRGSHYCLGAPLARLEAQIALETLFRRLPGLHLAVPHEQLQWRPTPGFRRVAELPVAW